MVYIEQEIFKRMLPIIILIYLVLGCSAQLWSPEIQENIQAYIENVVSCRRLTGLEVVISTSNSTLMQAGFGYKDVESGVPADENTRFCIGSLTKAFTSTLVGSLLAENEDLYPKSWDTPLKDVFGDEFELSEPYLTELMTIKDTLSHKTGFAPYGGGITVLLDPTTRRQDICMRFKHLEMVRDFRTDFLYNNWMVMLASCVAEVLGGADYETLVRQRIFNVLGMNNTLLPEEITDWSQIAKSYYINATSDEMLPLAPELVRIYPCDASGGICSPAVDMANWLRFHLAELKFPILPTNLWADTMTPCFPQLSTSAARPEFPATDDIHSYGMGWDVATYRGYRKNQHTGSISGFQSLISVYRDVDLAILTSSGGPMYSGDAHTVLHHYITDLVLGQEPWLDNVTACTYPSPWSTSENLRTSGNADHFQAMKKLEENQDILEIQDSENFSSEMLNSAWYDAYEGSYGHQFFGNITVFYEDLSSLLRFEAGKFGSGFLTPDGILPGKVLATFDGVLSYVHWEESSSGVYPPIQFRNLDNTTGLYQEIYAIAYDVLVPPTFYRGLQWDDIV